MTPLEVIADLAGPVHIPEQPVMLDGLLAWAVCLREQRPPIDGEPEPVAIPVAMHESGRFHLATAAVYAVESVEHRKLYRRPVIAEAQALGDRKRKRMQISGGPDKGYAIPYAVYHLAGDEMRWWCVGEPEPIRELLSLVQYVGKGRSHGLGRVARWTVRETEPWGPGFPLVRDGEPMRHLPHPWPGVSGGDVAYATVTYPYWQRTAEELCQVPLRCE